MPTVRPWVLIIARFAMRSATVNQPSIIRSHKKFTIGKPQHAATTSHRRERGIVTKVDVHFKYNATQVPTTAAGPPQINAPVPGRTMMSALTP